jgi:uncharacterized membrane protein required for colicin V production
MAMTMGLAAVIVLAWFVARRHGRGTWESFVVVLAAGVAVFLSSFNYLAAGDIRHLTVAWPWNVPIGFVVAFTLGYVLGRGRPSEPRADASG